MNLEQEHVWYFFLNFLSWSLCINSCDYRRSNNSLLITFVNLSHFFPSQGKQNPQILKSVTHSQFLSIYDFVWENNSWHIVGSEIVHQENFLLMQFIESPIAMALHQAAACLSGFTLSIPTAHSSAKAKVILEEPCSEQNQGPNLSEETVKYRKGYWGLWEFLGSIDKKLQQE